MTDIEGPWFPIIYSDECDGCARTGRPRCIEFCSNGVFTSQNGKAVVVHPEKCLSGCSACEPVCHSKAIQFPRRRASVNAIVSRQKDEELIRKTVCPKAGAKHKVGGHQRIKPKAPGITTSCFGLPRA